MKQTRLLMNTPVTLEVVDNSVRLQDLEEIFDFIRFAEERFSFFRPASEISRVNRGEIREKKYSRDLKEILELAEKTKDETQGFFDVMKNGKVNPSGIVKGWIIHQVALLLDKHGYKNFYVEAGGDIQTRGFAENGRKWHVGIKNPFKLDEIVKVIALSGEGIATSGNYYRGNHIYNPHQRGKNIQGVASLTVIAKNVLEADRFATAAFAMGKNGINFIESVEEIEGYMIDDKGIATYTSHFNQYIVEKNHV